MSSTKELDPKVKAEIKAEQRREDARIRKVISEYDFASRSSVVPPQIAPVEYSKTSPDGSSYPLSLNTLSSKFGGSGNLLSLLGKADGVPTSAPLAMSDFIGKGTSFRINGRINIDRWDSLEGHGLYTTPVDTWDRSDSRWLAITNSSDTIMGINKWRHSLNNSYEFVTWMTNYRVTNIRNLSCTWRSRNTELHREWHWYGQMIDSGGSMREITTQQRALFWPDAGKNPTTFTCDLVKNGVPNKTDCIIDLWGDDMDKVRSHIEAGFLFRASFVSQDNTYDGILDYHVDADFDVVPK